MIGGNITGVLQTKTTTMNEIGERVHQWSDVHSLVGWLGMSSGEKSRAAFNAKTEQSTHVFLTDFIADVYTLADVDSRMIVKGIVYEVTYIDNPDELDKQLEIYLKRVGAWNG